MKKKIVSENHYEKRGLILWYGKLWGPIVLFTTVNQPALKTFWHLYDVLTTQQRRMRCSFKGLLSFPLLHRAPPRNASRRRLSSSLLPPPPRMGKKPGGGQPAASGPDHPKDEAYLHAVISKRISAFESIKSEQVAHLQSISGDAIKYSLFSLSLSVSLLLSLRLSLLYTCSY